MGASRHFTGELTEFELFCAYHLGIAEDGSYRRGDLNDMARRFSTDPNQVEAALSGYRIDLPRIKASSFDLELARLDIEVAPPGIDRVELARTIFQDLLDAGCGVGPVPARLAASNSASAPRPAPDVQDAVDSDDSPDSDDAPDSDDE